MRGEWTWAGSQMSVVRKTGNSRVSGELHSLRESQNLKTQPLASVSLGPAWKGTLRHTCVIPRSSSPACSPPSFTCSRRAKRRKRTSPQTVGTGYLHGLGEGRERRDDSVCSTLQLRANSKRNGQGSVNEVRRKTRRYVRSLGDALGAIAAVRAHVPACQGQSLGRELTLHQPCGRVHCPADLPCHLRRAPLKK